MTPRRSVLYMPGANARALTKARELPCDAIIFDLEDAVAPSAKDQARDQVRAVLAEGGYGRRELVIRINGPDTPWYAEDLAMAASAPVHAVLLPKVETTLMVDSVIDALDTRGGGALALWLMIETPRGVLAAERLAGHHDRVETLVLGTSDLVKELRAHHTIDRSNLAYALQSVVLAARAHGRCVLDGVHLDFRDQDAFREACAQGLAMGFDGKTLIHPTQIGPANAAFGPAPDAVAEAREILSAWEAAEAEGQGVVAYQGRLIENLHVAEAQRLIAFADAIAERTDGP